MPYHVRVITKSNLNAEEIALDLTEQQLKERFIDPYNAGSAIVTQGRSIMASDIHRLSIVYTKLDVEPLLPFSSRLRPTVWGETSRSSPWGLVESQLPKAGRDVTDEFIMSLPGSLVNKIEEIERRGSRFLYKLCEMVDANELTTIPTSEVGEQLGFNRYLARDTAKYLEGVMLLEVTSPITYDDWLVRITHGGILKVKEALSEHSKSAEEALEIRETTLQIGLRRIQDCGVGNGYVNFPNCASSLFDYVEKVAGDSPAHRKYEESTQKWRTWLADENWRVLHDPEQAKQLAYTLYQIAAYSDDNGREGGVISQFSKQRDYQMNISRFNKILLPPFKQALEDIVLGEPQTSEYEIEEIGKTIDLEVGDHIDKKAPLKAFISYKWESDIHNKWVEKVAGDLRKSGIEAILDRWEVRLGDSFTDYMTSKINEANVVLFIMTTASVAAVEAPKGKGGAVKFEMQMATARRTADENVRLIGIYREGDKTVAHLRDHRYADFRDDSEYPEKLRELIDDLLDRSARPPLRGIEKKERRYQVPNVERKKEEAQKGKLTEVEQGSGSLDGEEGSPHPDMVTLENYESSTGGNFRIMANKQLDRATGDAHGLFFRIIHNAGESWSCVIKISGSLYTMLGKKDSNIGPHYEALTQLGLLRIKEAIEKSEPFSEFIFTGYDFPTDQEQYDLLARLKEVR